MIQTDNHTPNGSNEKPYRYVLQAGHGKDIINSKASENHNNQNIEIVFEKAYAADAIFFHSGNNLIIQAFNNQDSVTLTDFLSPDKTNICTFTFIFEDKTLNSKDIADITMTLNDTNKNNEPTDSHSNNSINDKIDDDKPYGENSNNILNEIASYSTLISGTGNDTLSGVNFQKDRYEFEAGHGQDVIYDKGDWYDKKAINEIVFKGANFADALFSRSGDDLIINAYGNSDSVTLPDYFSYNNYYSRSFNFIFEDQTLEPLDINNRITFIQNGDDNDNVIVGWWSNDIISGGKGNDTLWGKAGDDILNGDDGDDILNGDDGNDTLIGGAGNDTLNGGAGYDILIGGTGNDILKGGDWHKDRYEFEAGHGQDVIYDQGDWYDKKAINEIVFKGANFADALFSRSGNDLIINAYGNSDSVTLPNYFSYNNDYYRAFNFIFEDQTLEPLDINNRITFIQNGDDNDNIITGWWSNDIISGGKGNDTLWGKAGDDILNGDDGDDILNGDDGNDTLNGGAGNDTLNGGAGYDILIGGTGNDILKGGDWHKDRYEFEAGHGQDVIYDQGDWYDKKAINEIVFKGANFADALFSRSGNDLIINAYGNSDSVTLPNYFSYNNDYYRAFNFIFEDQTLEPLDINNRITFIQNGDDNDNIITGWWSNDIISGGKGNDTLWGKAGDDILNGDDGDDILNGDDGNDTLNGGAGNDTLNGGAGYDILIGGTGNDILKGGDWHKDCYEFEAGHGQDVIYDKEYPGYTNHYNDVVFKGATLANALFTRSGNDLVICAYGTDDSVTLPDYFNNSYSRAFNFVFDDQAISTEEIKNNYTFTITGDDGDNVIVGWYGKDILSGGAGNDTLSGGDGDDILNGEDGDDILNGEDGNDTLNGGAGNDTLNGGAGYDILIGGIGNDILKGGDWHKDRYEFEAGHGQDVIYDKEYPGYTNHYNDVVFKGATLANALFTRSGNDLVICAYDEDDSVTLPDYFNNSYNRAFNFVFDDKVLSVDDIAAMSFILGGTSGDDELRGWNSHDIIAGGPGNDKLYGGDGIDNLFGGTGNDKLYGENGNDYLSGGDGDDFLDGGAGYDILIGGRGNDILKGGDYEKDRYEFAAGHGQDVIYDQGSAGYQNQCNDIVFKGANFTDALFYRSGNNLIIKAYGNSESVTLSDYFNNSYNRAFNFIFEDQTIEAQDINNKITVTLNGDDNDNRIDGWWGNDLINGGKGNDKLYGNAGDDTYVFAKGHGQDIIYDTQGADTIQFTDVDFADVKFRKNDNHLIIYGYNDNDSVLIQDFFYSDSYTIENFVFKDKTITLTELRKDGMQLYGTSGNDTIVMTNGRVLVYGDDGDDNITTGSSNDVLDGGAGNDKLYGNAGNDTLIGGTGNDYMAGGTGNDTYVFAKGHGQDIIYDTQGADTIQFTDVDFADVKFRKSNNHLIIYGYNDNDSVLIQDFFYSDSNTIENFVFKDKTITLTELRKDGMQLYGTSGDDTIVMTNGRVLVYGDDGDDNITTGSSNDVLDGGAGNDKLYGNAGNDTLIGGTGNDYMAGGTGNDTYVFAKGHGQDIIYDTQGADTIQFTDVDFADVKFRKSNNHLIIYGYNDNDSVLIQDFFYSDSNIIENFVFKDKTITLTELRKDGMQLYGTSGDDTIVMTNGRVLVYGDDGDDNITTGSSNDVLDGGAGNDKLYGNAGNDTLIGGTGNDYMAGGTGNDTYVFAKGHGQDIIYDTQGADTIQFTDVDFADVKFRKNDNHLIIYGYNDNDSVLIQDFFYSDSYTIENFVFKDKTITLAELRKIIVT